MIIGGAMTTAHVTAFEQFLVALLLSILGGLALVYAYTFLSYWQMTGVKQYNPKILFYSVKPVTDEIKNYRTNVVNCRLQRDLNSCDRQYKQEWDYYWLKNTTGIMKNWQKQEKPFD